MVKEETKKDVENFIKSLYDSSKGGISVTTIGKGDKHNETEVYDSNDQGRPNVDFTIRGRPLRKGLVGRFSSVLQSRVNVVGLH